MMQKVALAFIAGITLNVAVQGLGSGPTVSGASSDGGVSCILVHNHISAA